MRKVKTAIVLAGALNFLWACPAAEAASRRKGGAIVFNDEENSLGLFVTSCAKYCWEGMSALDLWLSLEQVCDIRVDPSQGQLSATATESSANGRLFYPADEGWSRSTVAMACAGVWTASIYLGYISGAKVGTKAKGAYLVA